MLPQLDGYEILATIQKDENRVPVIILTARGEEADKMRDFRLNTNQYITKPFGVLELLEHVNSLLRHNAAHSAPSTNDYIRFGNIVINTSTHTITHMGTTCTLTPKTYELLLALIRQNKSVTSRTALLKKT